MLLPYYGVEGLGTVFPGRYNKIFHGSSLLRRAKLKKDWELALMFSHRPGKSDVGNTFPLSGHIG